MTTHEGWKVMCQDPGDGTGDVIVELPSELLEQLGWKVGDELVIETSARGISLRLKERDTKTTS